MSNCLKKNIATFTNHSSEHNRAKRVCIMIYAHAENVINFLIISPFCTTSNMLLITYPCPAEVLVVIFNPFEAEIADALSS